MPDRAIGCDANYAAFSARNQFKLENPPACLHKVVVSVNGPELVIAEDDATIRDLLTLHAQQAGMTVGAAGDGEAALALIGEGTEVVLLDLRMPIMDGFGCLERLAVDWPGLPAVVLSAENEAAEAVRAMKCGAIDYLTKPFNPDELTAILRNARRMRRAELENAALREALGSLGPEKKLIVRSEAMIDVRDLALQAAESDSPVLLTGENGVGKGTVARLIHSRCARASGPFLSINCAEFSRELLAVELFGNERGAFQGALRRRSGRIEAAEGGTLYLDDICELPLDLQGRLARLLERRHFRRVGGRQMLKADIRIIASTGLDLHGLVEQGSFREELLYRLGVLPISIPPLRERLEELEILAEDILSSLRRTGREQSPRLSRTALRALQAYDWPGNLRQLENVLEQSAAACRKGVIEEVDLPDTVRGSSPDARIPEGIGGIPLADLEREALAQTLRLCNGNKTETARRLGVTEKSIYNKMKRLGLM